MRQSIMERSSVQEEIYARPKIILDSITGPCEKRGMSLDVDLFGPEETKTCRCSDCGNEHETKGRECYFSQNITHNLGAMAEEAGIYDIVWRPEENGISHARQLIEPLKKAIAEMHADPPRFEKHNAPNGWGLYIHFVPWLQKYLCACEEYPDATVEVSR